MEDDRYEQIPKDFYSFETGAPFTHCIECGKNLMDGQPYLIEKAFKNHIEYDVKDTVFDYALCMKCAEGLRNEMSKESQAAIMKFFSEKMDFHQHLSRAGRLTEENISSCMITGKPASKCTEYQIYAYCIGDRVSPEIPPYMISGEVMDQLLPLLSKKTTDDLNGFFNKHFSPDPTLMEPIGPKFVLV
jgi:hypothetical protein